MRWLTTFAVIGVSWFFSAWMFMVVVGVVHADWLPQVPTIGYGLALKLAALAGATGAVRGGFGAMVKVLHGDAS